jgi:dolichyl-phosphate beta-glucosyltransferase
MENIFLSVVIPAYNEEKNLAGTLTEINEYLSGKPFAWEVIAVDDGSKDSTVREAEAFAGRIKNFRLIKSSPNRGKGFALRKGMLEAAGEYVLFMDADNSTSIKEMESFLPYIDSSADIIIASRRVRGASVEVPANRKIMGNVYVFLARLILGISVNDINCGFKVFKSAVSKKLFSAQIMNDWSFDAEVIYLAGRYGFRTLEVPVNWVHKDTSKVVPFRDGVKSFVSLINILKNAMKGVYPSK